MLDMVSNNGGSFLPSTLRNPPAIAGLECSSGSSLKSDDSSTKKKRKKGVRRSVSFSQEGPNVQKIQCVKSILQDELEQQSKSGGLDLNHAEEDLQESINQIWYDESELAGVKNDNAQLIYDKETDELSVAGDDDEDEQLTAQLERKLGDSFRGLERQTEEGSWLHFQNRAKALGAVLDTQSNDANELASLASEATEQARSAAQKRALQDEKEAKEYLSDVRDSLSTSGHISLSRGNIFSFISDSDDDASVLTMNSDEGSITSEFMSLDEDEEEIRQDSKFANIKIDGDKPRSAGPPLKKSLSNASGRKSPKKSIKKTRGPVRRNKTMPSKLDLSCPFMKMNNPAAIPQNAARVVKKEVKLKEKVEDLIASLSDDSDGGDQDVAKTRSGFPSDKKEEEEGSKSRRKTMLSKLDLSCPVTSLNKPKVKRASFNALSLNNAGDEEDEEDFVDFHVSDTSLFTGINARGKKQQQAQSLISTSKKDDDDSSSSSDGSDSSSESDSSEESGSERPSSVVPQKKASKLPASKPTNKKDEEEAPASAKPQVSVVKKIIHKNNEEAARPAAPTTKPQAPKIDSSKQDDDQLDSNPNKNGSGLDNSRHKLKRPSALKAKIAKMNEKAGPPPFKVANKNNNKKPSGGSDTSLSLSACEEGGDGAVDYDADSRAAIKALKKTKKKVKRNKTMPAKTTGGLDLSCPIMMQHKPKSPKAKARVGRVGGTTLRAVPRSSSLPEKPGDPKDEDKTDDISQEVDKPQAVAPAASSPVNDKDGKKVKPQVRVAEPPLARSTTLPEMPTRVARNDNNSQDGIDGIRREVDGQKTTSKDATVASASSPVKDKDGKIVKPRVGRLGGALRPVPRSSTLPETPTDTTDDSQDTEEPTKRPSNVMATIAKFKMNENSQTVPSMFAASKRKSKGASCTVIPAYHWKDHSKEQGSDKDSERAEPDFEWKAGAEKPHTLKSRGSTGTPEEKRTSSMDTPNYEWKDHAQGFDENSKVKEEAEKGTMSGVLGVLIAEGGPEPAKGLAPKKNVAPLRSCKSTVAASATPKKTLPKRSNSAPKKALLPSNSSRATGSSKKKTISRAQSFGGDGSKKPKLPTNGKRASVGRIPRRKPGASGAASDEEAPSLARCQSSVN